MVNVLNPFKGENSQYHLKISYELVIEKLFWTF